MTAPVLTFTDRGIYCPAADIHIDPWKPVDRAVVTHGHADHAREGMRRYLSTESAAPMIRHRLGDIAIDTLKYGETIDIEGVRISLHPAGHVTGSAQVRVEAGGEVWVVSGDYKLVPDGVCEPFEPIRCDTFITECTFGLPVFRWDDPVEVADQINRWWAANAATRRYSICGAYSLGKAQRILAALDMSVGPVLTHQAIETTNDVLRAQGVALPGTIPVTADTNPRDYPGAFVLAPPAAIGSVWVDRFRPASTAFASGWMALRGVLRRRSVDRGFVMSDHADWQGLNQAVRATGASRVFVTHGYTTVFRRWLDEQGYDAGIVTTEFGGDDELDGEPDAGESGN